VVYENGYESEEKVQAKSGTTRRIRLYDCNNLEEKKKEKNEVRIGVCGEEDAPKEHNYCNY
jgi:hypothetical protein